MALLEHQAQRIAEALDDYEHVSVVDIGGTDETGFWVVALDDRLDIAFEISSQLDYWNFVFRHAVGRPARDVGRSVVPVSQAATSAATA